MTTKKKRNAVTVLTREEYLRQQARSNVPLNIQLTNDYAFRKVFKNKKVLKGFLMALLKLKEDEIIDIEVTDPYEEGESEDEKEGILDIKVHLNNNQKLNLEMQNRYQPDWSERTIFYNCRMYVEGFEHGTPYGNMEPCIHIGILNFNYLKSPGFHHKILLQDKKTHEIYSDKFILHMIELKKLEDSPEEERDELYRWAKLIAADNGEMMNMTAKGNPYMEEAISEMDRINMSETERYLYLRRSMAYTDEVSRMNYATQQGIQEGQRIGEHKKLCELVEKKLNKGKTADEIADALEEDVSVIHEIIKELTTES